MQHLFAATVMRTKAKSNTTAAAAADVVRTRIDDGLPAASSLSILLVPKITVQLF